MPRGPDTCKRYKVWFQINYPLCNVYDKLTENLQTVVKKNKIKLAWIKAEHDTAMRSADDLVDVIKDIFKDSKTG